MPQLSQIGEIYASQLFWLAIVFALIYFGIGKAMVPRIEATVDDRNSRITGDIAVAEAARAAAAADEAAYQADLHAARGQAGQTVGTAKDQAAASTAARLKASEAVMATQLADAMTRIDGSRTTALAEIEAATVEAVEDIVAKLSGVDVDRPAVEQRVKAALAHG